MKRVAKWAGIGSAVVVLLLGGFVGYVQVTWSVDHPDTPFPDVRASSDPDVVARGEYLVHAVAHCSACHQPVDYVDARTLNADAPLVGGYVIKAGPFGAYTAANLTPHATGIGGMSDGELARAIRYGVNRDGKLIPIMRLAVGAMSDEDLTAIVSWLRAQEPIEALRSGPQYGFLARALSGKFLPRQDAGPPFIPEGEISVERGRYLAQGPGFCSGCHTPHDPMNGFAPSGPSFSGGDPEPDPTNPGFEVVPPNLTPHPTAGHIVRWTEDQFVERFRAGRVIHGSPMPWEGYARLTEEDVRSIYRYLMSLELVDRSIGPTYRAKGSFKG